VQFVIAALEPHAAELGLGSPAADISAAARPAADAAPGDISAAARPTTDAAPGDISAAARPADG
jgi:hypothetical protein